MKSIDKLTAGDVMKASLVCVTPDQKLEEAEHTLVERHVGGLPVVADNRLVGVISRSDITRARVLADSIEGQIIDELHWDEQHGDGFQHAEPERFVSLRQRIDSCRVKDVMRTQVVSCLRQTPIQEVAAMMVRNHVHRVIVVEGERPVGVISSLDLVELLARKQAGARN
jgi:CBS domain-containing protein